MKVIANCLDMKLEIPVGAGLQHVRWLGLVVATRMQREKYPHAFRVPQAVRRMDGQLMEPREVLCRSLNDGEEIIVELRQGAAIAEEDTDETITDWMSKSYGPKSNLMELKFHWIVGPDNGNDYPRFVRGDYFVAHNWLGVYPQKEFGGRFEIRVETVDQPDGHSFLWQASMLGPPGMCNYKFVMENGLEGICTANPETLTRDGTQHHTEFGWDVPICEEPYPDMDDRPSTASSRDGATVDPRFEQDWEAMRLGWIESFMKVRVKDVLTEFYAILIDLFDSYAFMGLDLAASQHTMGMDDWKHLLVNCMLLHGQRDPGLAWSEVGNWFEKAAGVKDGRPYLAQRLTRAHYLELLMRTAWWSMCEHPTEKYRPEPGRQAMQLDEGLFRFVTDILIPVMDVYDDDPIRKDAVQHQNLVVLQQSRSSIRSVYSSMAQPWAFCDNENVVVPDTLRFILQEAKDKLEEAERGGGAPAAGGEAAAEGEAPAAADVDFGALLGGEDKLNIEQLGVILDSFDEVIEKITDKHPEPLEQRALLFWEFFEVLMECCRTLNASLSSPLHEAIPAFVQTTRAVAKLVEQDIIVLPEPSAGEAEAEGDAPPPE